MAPATPATAQRMVPFFRDPIKPITLKFDFFARHQSFTSVIFALPEIILDGEPLTTLTSIYLQDPPPYAQIYNNTLSSNYFLTFDPYQVNRVAVSRSPHSISIVLIDSNNMQNEV